MSLYNPEPWDGYYATMRPHVQAAQTGRVPDGYELQAVSNVRDPYAKLDARDYETIPFGRLLVEDYGQVVGPGMPLSSSGTENPGDRHERRLLYSRHIGMLPPNRAVKVGLDVDLAMNSNDAQFCRDFLGFMSYIGYAESKRLPLGPTSTEFWVDGAKALLAILRPSGWRPLKWNDRCSKETNQRPLPSDYARFLGKVAAGQAIAEPPECMHAYPLQKLNPETYLYLCQDSRLRVRVKDSLLPVAPPCFANGPTIDLARDYEGEPGELTAKVITHMIRKKGGDQSLPFKQTIYPARVLSVPAKQRLADIAGIALNKLSAQLAQ